MAIEEVQLIQDEFMRHTTKQLKAFVKKHPMCLGSYSDKRTMAEHMASQLYYQYGFDVALSLAETPSGYEVDA